MPEEPAEFVADPGGEVDRTEPAFESWPFALFTDPSTDPAGAWDSVRAAFLSPSTEVGDLLSAADDAVRVLLAGVARDGGVRYQIHVAGVATAGHQSGDGPDERLNISVSALDPIPPGEADPEETTTVVKVAGGGYVDLS